MNQYKYFCYVQWLYREAHVNAMAFHSRRLCWPPRLYILNTTYVLERIDSTWYVALPGFLQNNSNSTLGPYVEL